MITAYTLAFGSLPAGGRIADLVGRERTFLVGLVGFAAAFALAAPQWAPACSSRRVPAGGAEQQGAYPPDRVTLTAAPLAMQVPYRAAQRWLVAYHAGRFDALDVSSRAWP